MANSKPTRAREEITLAKYEMRAATRYYKRCVSVLSDTASSLRQQATLERGGARKELQGKAFLMEKRVQHAGTLLQETLHAFSPYL